MNREIGTEEARSQEEEKDMLEGLARKLELFEKDRGNLIPVLQMIQETYSYLAPEPIRTHKDGSGTSGYWSMRRVWRRHIL